MTARNGDIRPYWAPLLAKEFPSMESLAVEQITLGGSTRDFFRLEGNGKSLILCEDSDASQFSCYIEIARYLRSHGIPVPMLLRCSREPDIALLEDGGPVSLQDLYGRGEAQPFYRKALEVLVAFQKLDTQGCPAIQDRIFGYDDYRWETSYFRENQLALRLGIDCMDDPALDAEFETLAQRLLDEPLFTMHRDFQSSNILVRGDDIFIIDFQSARRGPVQYDVASLLKDPYVCMDRVLHDGLLGHYRDVAAAAGVLEPDFLEKYRLLALQRLMQALGAYGFLSLRRGKLRFLAYIEPALHQLGQTLQEVPGFPRLKALVCEAQERAAALRAGA